MGVRLPAEYQEVEYLEKAATDFPDTNLACYIDTGIIPASDVVAYGAFKRTAAGYDVYFGAQSGTGTLSRWFINNGHGASTSSDMDRFCYWYNDAYKEDARNSLTPWYLLSLSNNGGSSTNLLNGDTQSVTFLATRFPNIPIYLFGRNTNGSPTQFSNRLLCKYFVIEKSGEKVRDFVPCYRKADNKPGMYDLVSQTFFVNQGNTEFLVGPDVIDSISPWMVARRRMLMRKPKLDTSPRIAQYGYGLSRSNTGITQVETNCYTEWYDVDPVATYQRTMTGSGVASGGTNGSCFQTKTETGGNWDYWPNRRYLHANSISIRFTLITSEIDNAYVYCASGGQIFFAGKNTPYYGYTNINDMPTGT